MSLRILLITVALASIGVTSLFSQTDILPYASETDLGKLIGQKARLEGVFHYEAFGMPAVAISGRIFFLLENPPSKRTFEFPRGSRQASVTGTLYLYDGNIQRVDSYQNVGPRYYFFNIDEAKINFGDPLKARNSITTDPMSPFYGSWRLDSESTEAEIFKFEDQITQAFIGGLVEAMKEIKYEIRPDRISTVIPKSKKVVDESYQIISIEGLHAELEVKNAVIGKYTINLQIDSEDRLVMRVTDEEDPEMPDFDFYYLRW